VAWIVLFPNSSHFRLAPITQAAQAKSPILSARTKQPISPPRSAQVSGATPCGLEEVAVMAVGSTPCGMAQSMLAKWIKRPFVRPVFRSACLVVLALVSVVVASGPAAPPSAADTKPESESPGFLPPYMPPTSEGTELPPTTLPPPDTDKKPAKPAPVVLPRIRTSPKSSAIPLPAHTLPFYSPSKGVSNATPPTASLLNPPPAVGVKPRSAADTILEIIIGQPRVLSFPDVPQRIALTVDEKDPVATLKEVPHKDHQW